MADTKVIESLLREILKELKENKSEQDAPAAEAK